MSAAGAILRNIAPGRMGFWCPGCDGAHVVVVEGPNAWSFNGSLDRPTFSPSVLVRSGHHVPGASGDCWCTYEARTGRSSPFSCSVCHSFVRDGQIQFLGDCTHALAGQTVPLPSWPADDQP